MPKSGALRAEDYLFAPMLGSFFLVLVAMVAILGTDRLGRPLTNEEKARFGNLLREHDYVGACTRLSSTFSTMARIQGSRSAERVHDDGSAMKGICVVWRRGERRLAGARDERQKAEERRRLHDLAREHDRHTTLRGARVRFGRSQERPA
jgi:hypothetical protein